MTTPSVTDDQAAIAAVPQRIVAAWAAHDSDAFADVFVEDGVMILPGVLRQGREEIRAFMAEAFGGPYKGTQVTGQPLAIKSLDTGAAVLVTQGGVLAPGETTVPADRAIRASWVVVKRDEQWRLAVYQNSPAHA
ncbi:SgcJ/EcaC family oxidoreductase [Micromonospora sp. NPDC051543]|uniref:SgcJ/EcaC family oxidoreductase n=1 Tax=Micromonospora sp. NPDC051543 TaxID=3364287 RepID=UPI0037A5E9F9